MLKGILFRTLIPPPPEGLGYQVCWGRISIFEEGKEILRLWRDYNMEKRGRGSNVIFTIIFGLKNIKWGKGKGTEFFFKIKIKILKNWDGEEYQVARNFCREMIELCLFQGKFVKKFQKNSCV